MHWHNPGPVRRPPGFIEPCLPTNASTVPSGPQWAYEITHDGFRFICRRDGDRVRVFSRRGHDWTDRVPFIAKTLAKLRVTSVTLDGEGVVCGQNGVADFDLLRAAVGRKGSQTAFLYAFDLLDLGTARTCEPVPGTCAGRC
jgi:bifunctional non-homologous end joining protein LigD